MRNKWEERRAALTPAIYRRFCEEIGQKAHYIQSERKYFGMLLDAFLGSLLSLSREDRALCSSMLMEDPAGFAVSLGEVLKKRVQATMTSMGGGGGSK